MRKHRHQRKPRTLWDGRYKPYYIILDLDDIDPDRKMDENKFNSRWWSFLDYFEEK